MPPAPTPQPAPRDHYSDNDLIAPSFAQTPALTRLEKVYRRAGQRPQQAYWLPLAGFVFERARALYDKEELAFPGKCGLYIVGTEEDCMRLDRERIIVMVFELFRRQLYRWSDVHASIATILSEAGFRECHRVPIRYYSPTSILGPRISRSFGYGERAASQLRENSIMWSQLDSNSNNPNPDPNEDAQEPRRRIAWRFRHSSVAVPPTSLSEPLHEAASNSEPAADWGIGSEEDIYASMAKLLEYLDGERVPVRRPEAPPPAIELR